MTPPIRLTPEVLRLVAEISQLLGRYEGIHAPVPQPRLRRENRIRSIQASLAIEGNTLGLDQVTAIFEGKRVMGPRKEVQEVQNAIELYSQIQDLDLTRTGGLLRAHGILLKGLAAEAGKFRSGAVGILKGSKVSHVAPPAKRVPELMSDLLQFIRGEKVLSPLIVACVAHYELEFIHPFMDGNGRIGRFLQSWILTRFHPAFEYLPIETLVQERQKEYYRALEASDRAGDSTVFVEFSLSTIRDAFQEFLNRLKPAPETPDSRLDLARREFKDREFTRKEYILLIKNISTATASRDLARGVASRRLQMRGTRATARYRFVTLRA